MKHRLLSVIMILFCVENLVAQENPEARSLPQLVAELLRTGDDKLLGDIVMKKEHFAAMLELELKRSPRKLSEVELQKLAMSNAKRTLKRAQKTLKELRAEATKEFGDLAEVRLVRVLNRDGKPMEENTKQIHTDIFLEMKLKSKVFQVKLDDCFRFLGQRRLGDGFKLVR